MLKNYLKIGWRNLMKDKTFTFLNVLGLSLAFGVAILLSMAAFFDLSFDTFHEHRENIYQVYYAEQTTKGTEVGVTCPMPLAPSLQEEIPGITNISRYVTEGHVVIYNQKELNLSSLYVDEDFFEMFSFPVLKGKQQALLAEKGSVVLTETTAKKLFGKEEAVGKVVRLLVNGKEKPFNVSAVLKNIPSQSTMTFELALRFDNHPAYGDIKDNWGNRNHEVFAQLQEGISMADIEVAKRAFTKQHFQNYIESAKRDGARPDADGEYKQLHLLPFQDRHFVNYYNGTAEVSRTYPYLILGIALLILFIACVNFVNMGIAKSSQRLKEIGMRKTLGAQKKQLFFQFWSESLLVFLVSVLLGIALSVLLLDSFKTLFRTAVSFEMVTKPLVIIGFLMVLLLITLLVGGYPAVILSRLGTIQSLKGKLAASGKNRVRDFLMILQFGIAIVLISGTLVLWSQLEYMRDKDLGFNKEQVLAFPIDGKKNSYDAVRLLREELQENPNILSISGSDNNLGLGKDGSSYTSILGFEYRNRTIKTHMLVVDYDYVETLDLNLVSGRSFNRDFSTDSLAVIINETMAKELGEQDPHTARITMGDSTVYSVIGVMKDHHFQGLNREIAPLTLFIKPDWDLYYAYVKIAPTQMMATVEQIENAWARIEPNATFLGSFLDENMDRTFRREKIMTTMISSGSLLAIALSCIGLFAISLLVVAERTKEIGVRKVVGASISSITFMLTKDFLKLVLFAFLAAAPVAWWFITQWLEGYPYRIELNIWFFLGAGLLAVCIALLTVGAKTIKAAMQNPVKSLRTE